MAIQLPALMVQDPNIFGRFAQGQQVANQNRLLDMNAQNQEFQQNRLTANDQFQREQFTSQQEQIMRQAEGMFYGRVGDMLATTTDPAQRQEIWKNARIVGERIGIPDIQEMDDIDPTSDEVVQGIRGQAAAYGYAGQPQRSGKSPEQIDRELNIKDEANEIRRSELNFRVEKGEEIKLTPTTQKILDEAQTTAFKSGGDARELELLAKDFDTLDVGGGAASTASEKFKSLLGSQEAVSDMRRRFRSFRASQAVTNLPPGVASDKDIELALSGFPQENANNETIKSFLVGQAKLARLNEAYNLLKSDLLSTQGDTRGLVKKWHEQLKDPDFQQSMFSGIQGIESVEDTSTRATFNTPAPPQAGTGNITTPTQSGGVKFLGFE